MATANHVLLRRITLSASASSVSFDSIPQTGYTDLKLVVSARTTVAARDDFFKVQFNGSSSNFSAKVLYGSGSGAASFSDTTGYAGSIDGANATASTFNNGEFYIPNYTSTTTAKSFSVDTVQEDNQTQAFITMVAGLWNPGTQAGITSITLVPNSGSFVANSTFSLYGIADANTTPVTAPKADGGDIIKTDGTYWYHAFLSTAAFKPQVNLTADVLQIAGGGGSGTYGGGGGAGGLLGFTAQALTSGTNYTCTVGAGGAGATGGSGTAAARGTSGNNSQFASLTTSVGGGGGGANKNEDGSTFTYRNGLTGGSGGGAAGSDPGYGTGTGGSGTSGQGYGGGAGSGQTYGMGGGGGGGAGGAGAAGAYSSQATGGVGLSTYSSWGSATGTGQNVSGTYYYAGGGGGYANYGNGGANAGGYGGGASGNVNGASVAGTASTGGGGAAGAGVGAAGGSGIIIIRYPV
jgi:hypothetical protein